MRAQDENDLGTSSILLSRAPCTPQGLCKYPIKRGSYTVQEGVLHIIPVWDSALTSVSVVTGLGMSSDLGDVNSQGDT